MRGKYESVYGRVPRNIPRPPSKVTMDFRDMEQRILADMVMDGDGYRSMPYGATTARSTATSGPDIPPLTKEALEKLGRELFREDEPKHYETIVTPDGMWRVSKKAMELPAMPLEVEPPKPKQVTVVGASYKDQMMHHAALACIINEVCDVLPELMRLSGADVLVAVGTSGCGVVAAVAARLGVPWLLARKKSDQSHGRELEGMYCGVGKAVFIDDCTCSGATRDRAKAVLATKDIEIVAELMYLSSKDEPWKSANGVWHQGSATDASSKAAAECRNRLDADGRYAYS